jgi:hypothetical protein
MGIVLNSYRVSGMVDQLRDKPCIQCSAGKGLNRVMNVHLNYASMKVDR